jgi:general secretion pathway protein H
MQSSSSERPIRRHAAFTLVEMIVVVVILAIAAAVIVPSFAGANSMKAVSGARMIANDLEYAQNYAIATGSPVTVTFKDWNDANANSYVLSNTSGVLSHPITKTDYRIVFSSSAGLNGLQIRSASFDGDPDVTFDALGAPDNTEDGTVRVRFSDQQYTVTVGPVTGRVTVTTTGS